MADNKTANLSADLAAGLANSVVPRKNVLTLAAAAVLFIAGTLAGAVPAAADDAAVPDNAMPETATPGTAAPEYLNGAAALAAGGGDKASPSKAKKGGNRLSADAGGFVLLSEAVPDAILEIRYYSTYNFVGARVDGYEEPVALLTKEAAAALKKVSDDLVTQGYRLKIFDAYRPQMAVDHFVRWAHDKDDSAMKPYFYPELPKDSLFSQGYIARRSGHSRGSTVDLTLFDMKTEKEVDMGGTFDYFGKLSHPDYTNIKKSQYNNRMILRNAMLKHGFKAISAEWWHFTLKDEPYPDTYFTFPVAVKSVNAGACAGK
ncbi:M15 family metallopeptidase [Succinimonas sp.]|uniref:M15 family metallopeptidase n=1 Tax=Succinimonas sp. TaxID=1936151 RepID=UPI003863B787